MTVHPTETAEKPLDFFIPDEQELARHDDKDEILRRGQNMVAHGQIQPVGAKYNGQMIFGHGRLLSARAAGIKALITRLFPDSLDDSTIKLIRASENLQRKDLKGYQKFILCEDLARLNGWNGKTLAEKLQFSQAAICHMMSPAKCPPEVVEALKAELITIADCYKISQAGTPQAMLGLLNLKLSGSVSNREELGRQSRRQRDTSASTAKLGRITCRLASGVSVVVSGEEMTLDEMIESLAEAGKEAKKARDQGLDSKTFQAVMRDRAKAGA